jgi:D-alanyl-D-alanine carboxypeptidase (penicillin-binding protein 5/6)
LTKNGGRDGNMLNKKIKKNILSLTLLSLLTVNFVNPISSSLAIEINQEQSVIESSNIDYSNVEQLEDDMTLTAISAVGIDMASGKILFDSNADEKIYPASTTKVWTAYLTIKYADDLDKKITITQDLSNIEPSSMFLQVGEEFTVRELLQVLMLKSANDVAVVLAEYISGSVENFAKLMNKEAYKIGCTNTNFVNPNGLPDDNHYSTAYDMALIAREASKNETLKEIGSMESVTVPGNSVHPESRTYKNTNKFLVGGRTINYRGEDIDIKYDIVDGLKTGYTKKAGRCLLSTASMDNMDIVVGVFGASGDEVYTDSRKVIDYCIENYQSNLLIDKDNFSVEYKLKKGSKIEGVIEDDYFTTDKIEEVGENNYKYDVSLYDDLSAPIKEGDVIGEINVSKNNVLFDSIPIISSNNVESSSSSKTSIFSAITAKLSSKKDNTENKDLKAKQEESDDISSLSDNSGEGKSKFISLVKILAILGAILFISSSIIKNRIREARRKEAIRIRMQRDKAYYGRRR